MLLMAGLDLVGRNPNPETPGAHSPLGLVDPAPGPLD